MRSSGESRRENVESCLSVIARSEATRVDVALDCFAEPVIGPRFARTRSLAMTRLARLSNSRRYPLGFLFVLIVGLVAGTISGIVGTGSSIMLMPVLVYEYGPKQAKRC